MRKVIILATQYEEVLFSGCFYYKALLLLDAKARKR